MNKPTVSIHCITYNHANFIKIALDSFLMQKTKFPFEICLGEDDSNDGTREICQRYAGIYPEKVRLFLRNRKDVISISGHATGHYNVMETLKECNGKYIAFCAGDDYWTDPYKLQKQVDFLEANPEYVLAGHKVQVVDEEGHDLGRDRDLGFKTGRNRSFHQYEMLGGAGLHPNSWVFRSSAIKKLPWYFNYCFGDDDVMMVTILESGKGYYLNEAMSHYRIHSGGEWSSLSLIERTVSYIHYFSFVRKKYPEYRKQYNVFIWARIKAVGDQLNMENMQEFLKMWFSLPKFPYRFSIPVLFLIFLAYCAKIIYVRLPEGFIGRIRNRKNQGF